MPLAAAPELDSSLAPIREKVLAGERLSHADGVVLYESRDIFTLGELANIVRERKHGRTAYYNINRHINYTNFCVLRCKFCSFYRPYDKQGNHAEDAYEYRLDEIVQLAREAVERGATEVHIVGGLHPKWPFESYIEMCRAIRAACPNLHIKAFTAIEIVHFTRISKPRRTIAEVLTALREAGLDSMPGGGAEIFDDRVHAEAYKAKVGEKHWFDVHRTAHELGIPTNATMLYGHVETPAERVTHMIKLREHQDESLARRANGECRMANEKAEGTADVEHSTFDIRHSAFSSHSAFNCFVPLSFIPEGSEFGHLPGPTGLDDLKTHAVARLMLDNFDHIKAFWPMQSPKLAQTALNWGVDDLDGTVVWYDITKREGQGTNRQELTTDQIHHLIREAGCIPVERDSLYREVKRDADGTLLSDVTTPRG